MAGNTESATPMEYVKAVVPYAENLKNKMAEGVLKEALNDEVLLLKTAAMKCSYLTNPGK